MALFGSKKKPEETKVVVEAPKKASAVNNARSTDRNLQSVIVKPHFTEKAVGQSERNVYTFQIHKNATKFDVRDAIIKLFGVTPVKVNIVNKVARKAKSRAKNRTVTVSGMKKAYVYLKAGDSITLV